MNIEEKMWLNYRLISQTNYYNWWCLIIYNADYYVYIENI